MWAVSLLGAGVRLRLSTKVKLYFLDPKPIELLTYVGHGVTLTATWLLTVAVIPGTWEEKDFPAPVAQTASSEAVSNEKQPQIPSAPPPPQVQ